MKINQKFFSLGIFIAGATVLFFMFNASALSISDITFPVAELGSCENEADCRAYCEKSENAAACLNFAKKYNLLSDKELAQAEKFAVIKSGPGGCTSRSSCETYCNDINHIDECVAFGEQNGFLQGEELEEAKKVSAALKSGAKLPGNCRNKNECEKYCEDPPHIDECIAFAQAAGFISADEAEEGRKFSQFMKRGETPGNCKSKDECESYCGNESNFEVCLNFAEKAGLVSGKDLEMAKKTGGKGPGNCRGKEQCENFCKQPENQKACFEFGKEHGLISEEDSQRMEEGKKQIKRAIEESPSEVRECILSTVGSDILSKIESGEFFGGPEIGDKMKSCFEKMMPGPQMQGEQGQQQMPDAESRIPGVENQFQKPPEGFRPPEGFQPPAGFDQHQLPQGQFPQGAQPPEGFSPSGRSPEGEQPPAGFQAPQNFQPPAGFEPPSGTFTPPPSGESIPPPTMMPDEMMPPQSLLQYSPFGVILRFFLGF